LVHIISEEAENLLDNPIQVDQHGFVRLVDYMGSDQSIVQAARVSYGAGTKSVREDRGLIRYLLRHSHTTPFEMVVLKFHIKCPIFVARQWVRHRTASINEESARYSILSNDFHIPEPTELNVQSSDNKQGRGEALDIVTAIDVANRMASVYDTAYEQYEYLLSLDVARETAREVLPVGIYTQFYWQMNLHNLLHFLHLRLDPHAQKEIRDYAEAVAYLTKAVAPVAYEAFNDYVLTGRRFSGEEMALIKLLISNDIETVNEHSLSTKSEVREFLAKFEGI
jgi:thymidylate synthase (FAD)